MVIMDFSNSPLADRFFAPLTGIADRCPAARSCPELPDLSWLHLGITRVLEDAPRRGLSHYPPSHGVRV